MRAGQSGIKAIRWALTASHAQQELQQVDGSQVRRTPATQQAGLLQQACFDLGGFKENAGIRFPFSHDLSCGMGSLSICNNITFFAGNLCDYRSDILL
jgi:hypothetical protein